MLKEPPNRTDRPMRSRLFPLVPRLRRKAAVIRMQSTADSAATTALLLRPRFSMAPLLWYFLIRMRFFQIDAGRTPERV